MDKDPSPSSLEEDEDKKMVTTTTSRSFSSVHLPSIEEKNLMNWSSWLINCPKCPGVKFPIALLDSHRDWHARVNLLYHLRTFVKNMKSPPFGPGFPGALLQLCYDDTDAFLEPYEDMTCLEEMGVVLNPRAQMPYVRLKFVEGLKYTIGNTLLDRGRQGEFIYFNLHEEEDDEEVLLGNYFSLECKEGGLWISRDPVVKGLGCLSTTVSVNGIPLFPPLRTDDRKLDIIDPCHSPSLRNKVKLAFGDIVSVVIEDKDEGKTRLKEPRFVDFVFKASIDPTRGSEEVINNDDTTTDETGRSGNPIHNPLILHHILSHLPTEIVQDLRLVSSIWNLEGLKDLRRRVLLTIFDDEKSEDISTILGTSSSYPLLYFHQISDLVYSPLMNELKFPHWRLVLPFDEGRDDLRRYGPNEARRRLMGRQKVLEDLVWLVDGQDHRVQTLQLTGRVDFRTGLNAVETVLIGLGNTLTSLKLEPQFRHLALQPSSSLSFPALQSISIGMTDTSESLTLLQPFLNGFLPTVGKIQTLVVMNPYVHPACRTHSPPLSTLILKQSFPHLREVTIGGVGPYSLEPLSTLPEGSLKKLDLKPTDALNEANGIGQSQLFAILGKHVGSLEDLTLRYEPSVNVSIHFPVQMRKLKTLVVLFSVKGTHLARRPLWFKFGRRVGRDPNDDDGLNRIDYNRRFPALSKLTVWPVDDFYKRRTESNFLHETLEGWKNFAPILTSFIQPLNEGGGGALVAVSSVKTVDIPFLLRGKYHEVLDDLEVAFPNVSFPPELEAARSGPVWTNGDEEEEEEGSVTDELEFRDDDIDDEEEEEVGLGGDEEELEEGGE